MKKRNLPAVIERSKAVTVARELVEKAKEAAAASISDNTKKAYRDGWADFEEFCRQHGVSTRMSDLPVPPDVIAAYLVDRAPSYSVATLELRLAAIAHVHKLADIEDPPTRFARVRKTMMGIRKQKGVKQNQKRPLQASDLREICPKLDARSRAILLLGFATGMRRSEIAALRMKDLQFDPKGILLNLSRSKTDQVGRGRWIGIHYGKNDETCPVKAVKAFLDENGKPAPDDSLFGVSASTIARTVKKAAAVIGLDVKFYSGHSLRAGLVTEAEERDIDRRITRRQTGHKSDAMLERYARPQDAFKRNVTEDIGL